MPASQPAFVIMDRPAAVSSIARSGNCTFTRRNMDRLVRTGESVFRKAYEDMPSVRCRALTTAPDGTGDDRVFTNARQTLWLVKLWRWKAFADPTWLEPRSHLGYELSESASSIRIPLERKTSSSKRCGAAKKTYHPPNREGDDYGSGWARGDIRGLISSSNPWGTHCDVLPFRNAARFPRILGGEWGRQIDDRGKSPSQMIAAVLRMCIVIGNASALGPPIPFQRMYNPIDCRTCPRHTRKSY